jgi:membrane-associated phospholipid phosphatase
MIRRILGLSYALTFLGLLLVLGNRVGQLPDPGWMMATEMSWVNHAPLIASFFTWLAYPYVLAPMCVVLIVVAVRAPEWRWPIAMSIVALLAAWQGADYFQHVFARPRRLDWIVKHETAFSFPSSHAAIATAFYLLWSFLIARSALPGRGVVAVILALIAFGIMWSRLALGAHYLTDIFGGVLLGLAAVALLGAIVPINVFEGRRGASLE